MGEHISKIRGWFIKSFWQWLAIFVLTWVLMAWTYPEILIHQSTRFMHTMDTAYPYENTFILAGQMHRGHLDLYNPFDGMSYAYAQMTNGLFTWVNALTAGIYLLTVKWAKNAGQYFHDCFSVIFYSLNALIRSLGCFFLAGLWTRRWWVKALVVAYVNVVLAHFLMNNGLLVNGMVSLLPLWMYGVFSYLQKPRGSILALTLLLMCVLINQAFLVALTFIYLFMHGVILAALGWVLIKRPQHILNHLSRMCTGNWWWQQRFKIFFVGLVGVIILLPVVLWGVLLSQDFYLANSGIGGTEGRLANIFSVDKYFALNNRSFCDLSLWAQGLLDHREAEWGFTWSYISAGAACLVLWGLIFARDKSVWICLAAYAWCISLNAPVDKNNIGSWAHWINVYTNPFQFLVRSYHMMNLISVFLLIPILISGVEGLRACAGLESWAMLRWRRAVLILTTGLFMVIFCLPREIHWPFLLAVLMSLTALILAMKVLRPSILIMALFALFIVDMVLVKSYSASNLHPKRHAVAMDSRSPLVWEWPEFYRREKTPFGEDMYGYLNAYGLFYGVPTFLERMSRPVSLYEPRPKIMKDFDRHADIQEALLNASGRMIEGEDIQTKNIKPFYGDEFRFHVEAKKDGPMTIFYPYDDRWKIFVDGEKIKPQIHGGYFLGWDITAGAHELKLLYEPFWGMRVLIVLALLGVFVVLAMLSYRGFKDEAI